MPLAADPAPEPIPRPGNGDDVRLVRRLFSDPPVALDEISAAYGPIYALGAGPVRVVVIGGPELIQQLLAERRGDRSDGFDVVGPASPRPTTQRCRSTEPSHIDPLPHIDCRPEPRAVGP